MSAAPRAERLRVHFVGWQCRIRADAMRRREGRPAPGMRPQALSTVGEELAPAVTTLLVRNEAESFAPEFRHLARRTHAPRAMRDAALALLAEHYCQYARDFSGLLSATFGVDSPLAAPRARGALPCTVAMLPPDDPRREETWWHNALFNPSLPPDVPVLAFAPRWLEGTADPASDGRR